MAHTGRDKAGRLASGAGVPPHSIGRFGGLSDFRQKRRDVRRRPLYARTEFPEGGAMHVVKNTRQEDDPNGLRAIAELIEHGKDDDFERQVSERLPEVKRVKQLYERVRAISPDVELSPYVMRIIRVADKHESARLAEVA